MAFGLGLYAMIAAHGIASTAEEWVSREWLMMGGELAKLFDALHPVGLRRGAGEWVVLVRPSITGTSSTSRWNGVVYGVAVALGFATLENLLFVDAARACGVAWMRALFAVPAHALFGATMGLLRRRAKVRSRRQAVARFARSCLFAPTVFHGCYDYALHRGMGAHVWDCDLVAVRGVMDVRSAPRPPRPARVTFSLRRGA
jgi:hypothetical protein